MLRLRQYVEDEFDRSVELSGGDNLEFTRKFDDCRLHADEVSLTLSLLLYLFEVVVQPIHPVVPRLLVLDQPLAQRPKVLRFQAVQPTTPLRPAPDESHLS